MEVFERLAQVANDIEKLFTGSLFYKIISNENLVVKLTFLIKNFYVEITGNTFIPNFGITCL